MRNEYSLVALMTDNVDFAERLAKKTAEVKKDKNNLNKAAADYSNRFKLQIEEGTNKKKKLLSEGASKGLKEDDIMREFGGFLPTVQTPILNLLYFLLQESNDIDTELYQKRDEYNKKYGHLQHEDPTCENFVEPPRMDEYLYGNMTHETFTKIKKLKALSHSPNDEEAFLAYKKCRELCTKYSLDFDKIPCNL